MSNRKTTFFYALLIAIASLAVGMVIASRLDLAPQSAAQTVGSAPPFNGAPITGSISSTTFRDVAKMVPRDRILIETDAPYLAPVPMRGKTNEPAYVEHTARALADVLAISPEELALCTRDNAIRRFRLNNLGA